LRFATRYARWFVWSKPWRRLYFFVCPMLLVTDVAIHWMPFLALSVVALPTMKEINKKLKKIDEFTTKDRLNLV
jgi:hypothetical protein